MMSKCAKGFSFWGTSPPLLGLASGPRWGTLILRPPAPLQKILQAPMHESATESYFYHRSPDPIASGKGLAAPFPTLPLSALRTSGFDRPFRPKRRRYPLLF